jgi:uncharacterized glyoxalase superfamily protein PhnB
MKPTPTGWPRITPALFYQDARKAIDWLCAAFGFEVRLLVEGQDGRVEHSELELGDGLIMVGQADAPSDAKQAAQPWRALIRSPRMIGGQMTMNLAVHVDDADAHCARARAAGAEICHEPETTDYGADYWSDRNYAAFDCEGHLWWFMQRMQTGGKPHGQ